MRILPESIEKRPVNDIYGTFGAENRGRTDTMFPSRDFKSLASAYSAIPAKKSNFSLYFAKIIVTQGFEFVNKNKRQYRRLFFLEASPRLELGVRILQTLALPLGYDAVCAFDTYYRLERETV